MFAILDHYVVHLKQTQCYILTTPQFKKKKKKGLRSWLQGLSVVTAVALVTAVVWIRFLAWAHPRAVGMSKKINK